MLCSYQSNQMLPSDIFKSLHRESIPAEENDQGRNPGQMDQDSLSADKNSV